MLGLSAYEPTKTENIGTARSGWWNPDHASRMAIENESWVDNLNGNGKKFVSSILNGISLANAAGANLQKKDMPNSLMKQIYATYEKNTDKDLHGHLEANGNSSVADVIQQCGLEREIADALSDYAVGGDYKKYSYFSIQRKIDQAEKNLERVKDYSKANYVDGRGKETPMEKIFESNLKNYKDYLKELKQINPLGNNLGKKTENGGKGSGNFGHAGRPEKVGGSVSGGTSKITEDKKDTQVKEKDYRSEQEGVDIRDGYKIGTEFADLRRELENARVNLKQLKKIL